MPQYRSRTTTHGRNMAGARALWRATGMGDDDFGKPIIAVSNSFTQFVPGHVHLRDLGRLVATEIEAAGGIAREFNTIAVDDGIAMGHDGMLYSLPSRELIADAVEYMVNAHCADALVCISNCDKITPGMLMAAMRLNVPTVFVSGGPMEAGRVKIGGQELFFMLTYAEKDKVRYITSSTTGQLSEGVYTIEEQKLVMQGTALTPNGREAAYKEEDVFKSDTHMEWVVYTRQGENWQPITGKMTSRKD